MSKNKEINVDFDTMAEMPKVHLIARTNNMATALNGLVGASEDSFKKGRMAVEMVNVLGIDAVAQDKKEAFGAGYKIASDLAVYTTLVAVSKLINKIVIEGMEVDDALDSFSNE